MNKFYDWTYDKDKYADLPSIVKDLHDNGQHYIMIVVSWLIYNSFLMNHSCILTVRHTH